MHKCRKMKHRFNFYKFFTLFLSSQFFLGQFATAAVTSAHPYPGDNLPSSLVERALTILPFDPNSCTDYLKKLSKNRITFDGEFENNIRKKEEGNMGIRAGLGLFFLGGLGVTLVPGGPLLYAIYAGSAIALGGGAVSFAKVKKIEHQERCLDYAFLNYLEKNNLIYEIPAVSNKNQKDLDIQVNEYEYGASPSQSQSSSPKN